MKHATKHIYMVRIFVYTAFKVRLYGTSLDFQWHLSPFSAHRSFFSFCLSILLCYCSTRVSHQYHTIIFVLSQKLLCKNYKELNSLNEIKNVLNRPKQSEIFYLLTVNENLIFYKRKLKPKNLLVSNNQNKRIKMQDNTENSLFNDCDKGTQLLKNIIT